MNYENHKIYTSKDTTPRQRRLSAQRDYRKAKIQFWIQAVAGGILLAILFVILSFL